MAELLSDRRDLPEASVARYPGYLAALTNLAAEGVTGVSSAELAELTGVGPAKLRKDLSYLGSHGVRGVGYDVALLSEELTRALGLSTDRDVILIGLGNLGRALASYGGFGERGFSVTALLDVDPSIVGTTVAGVTVRDLAELPSVVTDADRTLAVIATPGSVAQAVCDDVVRAGIRAILNFAPTVLTAPEGVVVRRVDLTTELQLLAFHALMPTPAPEVAP